MKTSVIKLDGGLDTSTSPLGMAPGNLIGVENYEPRLKGGYERLKGLEYFDGRPRPSDATFIVLGVATSWGAGAVVGATLTGSTSLATGVICYVSGTLLAVTKVTGTFQAGETVTVSAVSVGTSILYEPAITGAQDNTISAAAAAIYLADIDEVPGEGPVCGVCAVGSTVYAFRNNVGSTKQVVWKATSSGWAAISKPTTYTVRFSSGNGTYAGGALTLTQGGNTATLYRMHINSGALADGDAEGVLILDGASTPGAFTSGAASGSGLTLTLLSGYAEHTLTPSGRWQFQNYAFSDTSLTSGVVPAYGVDGVGNFIEFDGLLVAPIRTSAFPAYIPTHLACHKNHCFISIRGSLWFSGLGNPGSWSVFTGGGEILIGDTITEISSIQGSEDQAALLVCCENKSQVIYGNDSTDWKAIPLSRQVGAKAYSLQQIGGTTVAMDEQGVRNFTPSQAFGNFTSDTLTDHIRNKVSGKTPTASVLDRAGGRYRLFFSDGSFISGVPGKRWSWTICFYPFTVSNAIDVEINGVARIFLCGADGYVYEADRGRNFYGSAITAWLKTAYAHLGSPTMRKSFRMMTVEARSETVGSISVQPDYSYGDTAIDETAMAAYAAENLEGSDAAFDLGNWDVGTWDANYLNELRVRAPGVGENVSVLLHSSAADELTHELTAITHYYLDRRQKR